MASVNRRAMTYLMTYLDMEDIKFAIIQRQADALTPAMAFANRKADFS